jgi:hypothetical protein
MSAPTIRSCLLALVLTAAGACSGRAAFLDAARRRDSRAVVEELQPTGDPEPGAAERGTGDDWIVVTGGRVAGRAPDHEAAVRTHVAVDDHRYVFRMRDLTPQDVELAFLPAGGGVAGAELAAALGVDVEEGSIGDVTLRRGMSSVRLRVDDGRPLELEVSAPGAAARTRLLLTFDPSFDGTLLLPVPVAERLGLSKHELPGRARVRVALGRPFEAVRSLAVVRIPALDAENTVEVLTPTAAPLVR